MRTIAKYTFGMGDRFAHQGEAQLRAILQAREAGLPLCPVWNKSNREHTIIHSRPDDLRAEADAAVRALGWTDAYYVDADHIGLKTVDGFIAVSDFYTLDVADFVGAAASDEDIEEFLGWIRPYFGTLVIPGILHPFEIDADTARAVARKFLLAMQEAGRIHRYIEERKGPDFVTEVSVDETDSPQTPVELLLILAMIRREGIPVQTIAPKFTGRFNKGVDYVGDLAKFENEFDEDLAVIAFAVREFELPAGLKLSVHSGSDKFSLYPIINRLVKKHDVELIVNETVPALRKVQAAGKARFVGITCLPVRLFRQVMDRVEVDQIQSYCHYCLNDTALADLVPSLQAAGVAIFNSAPLAMRLHSTEGPPAWHPAPAEVTAKCAEAARYCRERGGDLSRLALQFSVANPDIPTHIVGTANPARILQNIREIAEPIDWELLSGVQAILAPIHNVTWPSGRPENN